MPRSIEALKNDRKVIRVSQCLHKEIDTFRFSGPEHFFADAPLILLLSRELFFDVDLIDFDASTDRSAQDDRKSITQYLFVLYRRDLTSCSHRRTARNATPCTSIPSRSSLSFSVSFFFSLSLFFFLSFSLSSFSLPLLDLGTKFKSALVTREKTCSINFSVFWSLKPVLRVSPGSHGCDREEHHQRGLVRHANAR